MSLQIDRYRLRRSDNIASTEFWNRILEDLDARLALLESMSDEIDAAKNLMTIIALQRLDDALLPVILDAQNRLANLGVSFSAESLSSVTIGTGTKSFTLTDASAAAFVATDYVKLRASADQTKTMLGQYVSFDRPAKLLTLNVVQVEGSGTYADWLIRIGTPPDLTHADRTDNPHAVTAAQLGNPAGSAPAYTAAATDATIAAAIALIPGVDLTSRLAKAANLSDLGSAATARTNLGLGALAVLSTVGYGDLASNIPAAAADFLTNAASKFLTPNGVWSAAGNWVTLTDAATIAWDHNSAGVNFRVTLGGNRTLAFPTNPKPGQSGIIDAIEDGSGGHTLSFAQGFHFDSNSPPTLDTGSWRVNTLYYQCRSTSNQTNAEHGVRIGMAFRGLV